MKFVILLVNCGIVFSSYAMKRADVKEFPEIIQMIMFTDKYQSYQRIRHLKHDPQLLNKTDNEGNNVLHLMAQDNFLWRPFVITSLKEKGITLDLVNHDGDTPLLCAAREGNISFALGLIKAGANPAFRNAAGQTALHLLFEKPSFVKHANNAVTDCYDLRDKEKITCFDNVKKFIALLSGECASCLKDMTMAFLCASDYDFFLSNIEKVPPALTEELVLQRLLWPENLEDESQKLLSYFQSKYTKHEFKDFLASLQKIMNADEYCKMAKSINAQDVHGNTPLHYASKHGACFEILVDMIILGAQRLVLNNDNKYPFHFYNQSTCACTLCTEQTKNCLSYKLLVRSGDVYNAITRTLESIDRDKELNG